MIVSSPSSHSQPKYSWGLRLRRLAYAFTSQPLRVKLLIFFLLVVSIAVAVAIVVAVQMLNTRLSASAYSLSVCDSAQCEPPYWVSLRVDHARMRKGPSIDFPALWEYHRRGLPLQVIDRYGTWRKVKDPDGDSGWMAVRLLSRNRTALIVGEHRTAYQSPDTTAPVAFHIAEGTIIRLEKCDDAWCAFSVQGHEGWIPTAHIWGV